MKVAEHIIKNYWQYIEFAVVQMLYNQILYIRIYAHADTAF